MLRSAEPIWKFFMNKDIRSSVFGNFSLAKIFGLRYSEIFHERRSSVFGIRKFFKNEDLRSSVFGNFSWTKIFGLRYSVKITLRCNSGIGGIPGNLMLWHKINKHVSDRDMPVIAAMGPSFLHTLFKGGGKCIFKLSAIGQIENTPRISKDILILRVLCITVFSQTVNGKCFLFNILNLWFKFVYK